MARIGQHGVGHALTVAQIYSEHTEKNIYSSMQIIQIENVAINDALPLVADYACN